jgi:hypothetical protein
MDEKIYGSNLVWADDKPRTRNLTFHANKEWAMRITANGIEVNKNLTVTDAAKAVLDVVQAISFPKRVPLTDERINFYALQHTTLHHAHYDKALETHFITEKFDAVGFARAIERAHGIGVCDG